MNALPVNTQDLTAQDTSVPQAPLREAVDVAVGVLIRADGAFLLTSRPPGKVYAGFWEFPGGKLEAGESVDQALRRELFEEIGIQIAAAPLWRIKEFDYSHARVRLHFCKVVQWQGEFEMREGQQMAWETLPVRSQPVLPGTVPVLEWLAAEQGHEGPTHLESAQQTRNASALALNSADELD